jgi:hypothetical protein
MSICIHRNTITRAGLEPAPTETPHLDYKMEKESFFLVTFVTGRGACFFVLGLH